MRWYAFRASRLAQNPFQSRRAQVPDKDIARARSHKALLEYHARKLPRGTLLAPARTNSTSPPALAVFCAEQSEMSFVRAGTSKVNFGCLHSSCINTCLRSQARSAQVPEGDFARARSYKAILQHRARRRPRRTLLVQARSNSTSPMSPKTWHGTTYYFMRARSLKLRIRRQARPRNTI